ncbi:MAG: regulatory protein RecX [Candidatus Izemoplasmatales bacterium]|jgi:regulatory protein
MPKVTALKRKKRQYEVTFMFDDGSEKTFVCSEDLVVSYRLVRGKEINSDRFKVFLADQAIDGLIEKARRYAATAPRSEKEIDVYLTERGASPKDTSLIKAKLKKIGLIDDSVFSRNLVESMFYEKRFGKEKILFTLEQRGFPRQLLKNAVAMIHKEDVEANLEYLFQKKLPSLKSGSVKAASEKMKRYLLARGYEVSDVIAYVDAHQNEFSKQIDEEKEIYKDYQKLEKRYEKTTESKQAVTTKIIKSLLAKGYQYSLIKKTLERRR